MGSPQLEKRYYKLYEYKPRCSLLLVEIQNVSHYGLWLQGSYRVNLILWYCDALINDSCLQLQYESNFSYQFHRSRKDEMQQSVLTIKHDFCVMYWSFRLFLEGKMSTFFTRYLDPKFVNQVINDKIRIDSVQYKRYIYKRYIFTLHCVRLAFRPYVI